LAINPRLHFSHLRHRPALHSYLAVARSPFASPMAANLHASPPRPMHAHHGSNIQQHHRPNGQGPMPPGPPPIPPPQQQGNILTVLAGINEESWMRLGLSLAKLRANH
jgi:hypothetical protein